MAAAALLSGCRAAELSSWFGPTATPLPAPTPTPLPSANGAAHAFLEAWQSGDYATMYSLLTPAAQARFSQPEFQARYTGAQTEATVEQVEVQLLSLLHEQDQASVLFELIWHTLLFDDLKVNNQLRLAWSEGRWGIDWQPTMILPQLGEGVSLTFLSEQPTRGNIYDRNFHALATQGERVTIGLVPQQLEQPETVIYTLAEITGVSPEKIIDSINASQPDWFVPVADVSFETSLENDALLNQLVGVNRRTRSVRAYSDGDVAAHLIGILGPIPAEQQQTYLQRGYNGDELVGLTGIEVWGEEALAGQRGGRLVTVAPPPGRQVLSEIATVTSGAGSSVYLTLDTNYQAAVERMLANRKGAVVVMNPDNGDIYALATYPRFEPQIFTTGLDLNAGQALFADPNQPLINRATQGTYPPGSIFKIVTLAGALEKLKLAPETTFTCTGKWAGLGPQFEKKCWLETGHGQINLIDGLTQSCNVVFYEIGLALHRTDPNLLPELARSFGFGLPTEIIGVEEAQGVVPDNEWARVNLNVPLYDGDAVNTAIGQGYTLATPLQTARMLAAIGNGGRLVQPRVADRIVSIDGQSQKVESTPADKLPISKENLALIRRSLEDITSDARGTARQAFEGIDTTVAGKTGTAESGRKQPHAWFAGYAPSDKPRVAIAVLLEEAGQGSQQAAPLFRQVLESFFVWESLQKKDQG